MPLFAQLPPDISWADYVFDGMMICRAAVYKSGATGQIDVYGQPIDIFELLPVTAPAGIDATQGMPCFVRPEAGKELNVPPAPASETSYGIATFMIFMRPIKVDTPPVDLNLHHWLQILTPAQVKNGEDYKDPNDPLAGAVMYNITNINNPAKLDHHLEINATVIEP
jgi:hypothetical protein